MMRPRGPRQPRRGAGGATAPRPTERIEWRRLLGLLRPYRWRLAVAGVLLILFNGLGLIFPLVIRTLLNSILVQRNAALLNQVVIFLIGIFVAQAVVGAVQGYLITSLGERLSFDLRTQLFRHLQRLPMAFFDARRTGEL